MADTKITALTALTAADPANDVIPIVDVSDTTMAASGTTKKISVNNILGASGTATLASATITGALVVDTSTLVVDATNNRVGIGTASPVNPFDVVSTSGTLSVFKRTGSNGAFIGIQDGSGSLAYLGSNNGVFSIQTPSSGYSDKLSVDSSGNVLVGVASANANGGVLQLKSGITFPATQVAASDANTLDDYEEGTFTPIVQGSTTAGVGVYSTQLGRYTKVGRLVTVEIYIVWTAHTGTGILRIGGLPFTVNAANYSAATIGLISNIALSASNTAYAFNEINTTFINIVQSPVGGGSFTDVPMDVAGTFVISSTYSV
jgi:hypothetical protein